MALPSRVKIVEVSPATVCRMKGIRAHRRQVELIDRLAAAGFPNVEAASSSRPWVPQMADGAEVMTRIARRPGTITRC